MNEIFDLWKNYSKRRGEIRPSKFGSKVGGGVIKNKINDLMENVNIEILNSLSNTLDTMKVKEKKPMDIYCLWSKYWYALRGCSIDKIVRCFICKKYHDISSFHMF